MHTYLQICIHTYICAYIHRCIQVGSGIASDGAPRPLCRLAVEHLGLHIHTCIHTHTHTYIHRYIHTERRRHCLTWCPTTLIMARGWPPGLVFTYMHTHTHTYIHACIQGGDSIASDCAPRPLCRLGVEHLGCTSAAEARCVFARAEDRGPVAVPQSQVRRHECARHAGEDGGVLQCSLLGVWGPLYPPVCPPPPLLQLYAHARVQVD